MESQMEKKAWKNQKSAILVKLENVEETDSAGDGERAWRTERVEEPREASEDC